MTSPSLAANLPFTHLRGDWYSLVVNSVHSLKTGVNSSTGQVQYQSGFIVAPNYCHISLSSHRARIFVLPHPLMGRYDPRRAFP